MKGIFNWNVKQLFLYLTAEYSTKNNVSLSWAFDYCKNQQISCTFFPKIFTRNWVAAYLQEHLKKVSLISMPMSVNWYFCCQSNAWLLGFKCSAHILVSMQKFMEKLCGMKKFLSTNTRKRSVIGQSWWKRCSLY